MDCKLHFDMHIENIRCKAFKMFGFVMRASINFKHTASYITLYNALVRSQLEYAVLVWNPFYKKYTEILEKIQAKFLKSMHYRCCLCRLPYDQLLKKYKLITLEARRSQLEAMFVYDLWHNKFDCPSLVNQVCYGVPNKTHYRNIPKFFATSRCRTNAGKRSPLHRILTSYNDLFNAIDIAATSPGTYKKLVLQCLN